MRSSFIKTYTFLFLSTFAGVYLVNMFLIARSSYLISPFNAIFDLILRYSGILLIGGYFTYFTLVSLLVFIRKKSYVANSLLKLVVISSYLVVFCWIFSTHLEGVNYPNYVFSTYSIYLPSLQIFAYFQVILLVNTYFLRWHMKNKTEKFLEDFVFPMILVILSVLVFLGGWPRIYNIGVSEIDDVQTFVRSRGILENTPDFTRLKTFSNFVKKYTEHDSVLIHPKQSAEYPVIGNQPLIRYYFYPRTLVSSSYAKEYIKSVHDQEIKNIYYLVVKSEKDQNEYFPDEQVNLESSSLKLTDGRIVEFKTYDEYKKGIDEYYDLLDIGIIKVK